MTLELTPEVLARTYDFLRATKPFRFWKLPPSDEVDFRVTNHRDRYGHHCPATARKPPLVAISKRRVGHTRTLIVTMAHEMVHFRAPSPRHGPVFDRLARQVCKYHGFDPLEF